MKINHSNEIASALHEIMATMQQNERSAEAFNEYLDNRNETMFSCSAKAYRSGRSPIDAFLQSSKKYLMNEHGFYLDDEARKYIRVLSKKSFMDNPYYKHIHFDERSLNGWKLKESFYAPFEGFVRNEIIVNEKMFYKEITPFGFFLERFPFLAITQNERTWMSVTPHEIATMEEPLSNAKGKALTFGLGMGYYAFMASMKQNVEEITIVENDKNAISLFNNFILPQFPFRSKISIIEEDAFRFAKEMKDGDFDDVFIDIWHFPIDGLFSYLKFVPTFSRFIRTNVSYWIEKSILVLLRRAIIILLTEEFDGATDKDYEREENATDELINSLHRCLKNDSIETIEDLLSLLSEDNLKKIAAQKLIQ